MEQNLFKYIWSNSRKDQLWMLLIILLSLPTYFLSLELPKRLVNEPIQGQGFETPGDTDTFFQFNLPYGEELFGKTITLFQGFQLDRTGMLFALSFSFLFLVFANGFFKLYINTYKGRMGERILRQLRYELFDRVLRYPLARFKRTKPSEIATMIKDEVEPMGEFIGDAFTNPLFLGGQAFVALLFIFLQNAWLGGATIAIIAFQGWLVPRLRRKLLELQKRRQVATRKFAGRLGEIVESIQDSHTNDTTNYQRAEISNILSNLFFIRFELFKRKFSVKFINNFLIQFLAFFFYAVGGYLAINGTLDVGQLIGVIIAYKDLPAPIKGLIDHDQKRLSVEVRYKQVIEQFSGGKLQDSSIQRLPEHEVPHIEQGFEIANLEIEDDSGQSLTLPKAIKIKPTEKVAVVGNFASGATMLMEALGSVVDPKSGKLLLDGAPLSDQPEYLTGRRISYLDGTTFFQQGSIYDVLTYALKHQPAAAPDGEVSPSHLSKIELIETKRSKNSSLDFNANWIDYQELGLKDEETLKEFIYTLLKEVGIEQDIYTFGQRSTFNPEDNSQLAEQLIIARKKFRKRLDELGFANIVEPFNPKKYNSQSSIAENILFGTSASIEFSQAELPNNPTLNAVLKELDLDEKLFKLGLEVAKTTVELFGEMEVGDPFLDQLTYMDPEDLPQYKGILSRLSDPSSSMGDVDKHDQAMVMHLAYAYIEEENRLGLLTDDLKKKILEARKMLHENLDKLDNNPIAHYDPKIYNPSTSVIENVLFGKISTSAAKAEEQVSNAILELLQEMDLMDDIFNLGLNFNIGSGGKRLSDIQRQKLHLARTLLKKPDILIVNKGMSTLGSGEQEELIKLIFSIIDNKEAVLKGVIWAPMNPAFSLLFDRVLYFEGGTLKADGKPRAIMDKDQSFNAMVS